MKILPLIFFLLINSSECLECENILDENRFDCFPEGNGNKNDCEIRGCCWFSSSSGAPNCFYPNNFTNYRVVSKNGFEYTLQKDKQTFRPNEILNLKVKISYETSHTLRVQIIDPNNERYQVPISNSQAERGELNETDYQVYIGSNPFSIKVYRKSSQKIIFDTSVAPLIYADQYIQFSTSLASDYFYGLGEHKDNLAHGTDWSRYSFWNRDVGPTKNTNLYGTHPFYMTIDKDGDSMGFYLLNSNAMEVLVSPNPALTFITIGGIIDFYLYLGPGPSDVVFQHSEIIGLSQMPQYFTLGFHLCRWGYNSSKNLVDVIRRNRAIGIPYDVQWTDIDAMRDRLDWTYDKENFASLPEIVQDLHNNGQHYVNIIDPGIHNTKGYDPYDRGIEMNVFIKYSNSSENLVGSVWPGTTVYPDFTNPNTSIWWNEQARNFYEKINFDGLWIDMNEPSNFVEGSIKGCTNNKYDEPPYLPKILNGKLYSKSICPSAEQYLSSHYNLHNMYGHFESIASYNALKSINQNKRPFVLTRSSFSGTGKYAAHWTGDNSATWEDLYYSIPAILSFNMFGIAQVGADICGFNGDTTEELCIRWMQLGAFYPFMRNHNSINNKDQDPAVFSPNAQEIMKKALKTRYALLPYIYSLFFINNQVGLTIARPVFFEYRTDLETHKIDRQFMLGEALLITPVLEQGAKQVQGYFPNDVWYNYRSGSKLDIEKSQYVTFDVTLDDIPIHVRGGRIIPYQHPDINTKKSRENSFGLIVALKENSAAGYLFWDDGESFDYQVNNVFNYFLFFADYKSLEINRDFYNYETKMTLSDLKILGVEETVKQVKINDIPYNNFTYDQRNKVLKVQSFNVDMLSQQINIISWN